jgi:hypothetical protein
VAGEVKGALNFSAGYMDTPSSILTNFGPAGHATCPSGGDYSTCQGDFSIDVWVNLAVLPTGNCDTTVDKRSDSLIGYSFYLYGNPPDDNGDPWMGVQLADKAHGFTNYGSPALSAFATAPGWHHLAVTVARTSPGMVWYFDGYPVPNSPTTIPTQTGSLLNTVPLRIGASVDGGSNFNGSLDELQIFNRVLTATEVLNIFTAGESGQCKP